MINTLEKLEKSGLALQKKKNWIWKTKTHQQHSGDDTDFVQTCHQLEGYAEV